MPRGRPRGWSTPLTSTTTTWPLGANLQGAHAIEEWVSLSDIKAVAHTLVGVAARLCG
jgi:acetylornithine deacetylase/succinyl-diaminopimelate desuccinylase-like protein